MRCVPDAADRPCEPPQRGDEAATLPELLVAAALVLVTLAMVGSSVLPALVTLDRSTAPDDVLVELERAADTVARVVRAARPGPEGEAVAIEDGTLIVHLTVDSPPRLARIVLAEGTLSLTLEGDEGPGPVFPTGPITTGLDDESALTILRSPEGDGAVDGVMNGAPAGQGVAVAIELVAEGRQVARVVRLRTVR